MHVTRLAIEKPLYTWMLIVFCVVGGLWGFLSVGRLEDPAFTIKQAVVVTSYPGATAAEVATEVSEPLESAIQKMGELKTVSSRNLPGLSTITVEIQNNYGPDEIPQVWDDLRDKVSDATGLLPPGARTPVVNDGFGDVFGILYAVSADGFTDAEIHQIASFLRRELLVVDGVADVELRGLPEEAIFVLPSTQHTLNLSVPPAAIVSAIASNDILADAGARESGGRELQIETPVSGDPITSITGLTIGFKGETVNLIDFAAVERGRIDNPRQIIRFNGRDAFTIGVAGLSTENIVEVGYAIEERLDDLDEELPFGVEINRVYEQHIVVETANNDFLISLAISVAIVIGVLAVFMGWRAAAVVGTTLLLTVTATFFFMSLWSIEMERISLGALIIAMGMLVDNAIVVAEAMQVDMQRGMNARRAASGAASKTQVPLLGATIIGIMAFAGIGLSDDSTGEFLFSLFAVIAISLLLSWVLAVTVTPLMASYLFRIGAEDGSENPYDNPVFRGYGTFLRLALRLRWLVIGGLIWVTVTCFVEFGSVKQQFFPNSNTPLFYLNYKLMQGSPIGQTSEDLKVIEKWLTARDDVESVTTTVGQGLTRFMLTYRPEFADPSYGQLIIRTATLEAIPPLQAALDEFAAQALPHAEVRTKRLVFGPGGIADVEARLSGRDPDILRALGELIESIFRAETEKLTAVRTNWRERELSVQPIYADQRAQAVGVSRAAAAQTIKIATDGTRAGQLREGDRQIPIIVRAPASERAHEGHLMNLGVYSDTIGDYVALGQVLDGFEFVARDTRIHRRNRELTLSVEADAAEGFPPPEALAAVRDKVEALNLPPGYRLEWGGEHERSTGAQKSLGRQMPLSFLTMIIITILLFGRLRQTLVIWLLVPMAVNGVALGLLGTGLPFSFTALLGLLSLSGMLIKNGIVLVEEIENQKDAGLPQSQAIVAASISRVRPVVLAAATTILGMIPLLWDAFFASMAVTIMGGLAFASLLTLVAAPVFYHTILRKERLAEKAGRGGRSDRSAPPPGAVPSSHAYVDGAQKAPAPAAKRAAATKQKEPFPLNVISATERSIKWFGLGAALILLPLLILVRIIEITSRSLNIPGSLFNAMESELFLLFAFLIIGYAYVADAHVRVDILRDRLSERLKARIEIFGTIIFVLPFASIVLWYGATMVDLAYHAGERSAVALGEPYRWVLVAATPVGIGLFALAALCRTARHVLALRAWKAEK